MTTRRMITLAVLTSAALGCSAAPSARAGELKAAPAARQRFVGLLTSVKPRPARPGKQAMLTKFNLKAFAGKPPGTKIKLPRD